MHEWLSSHTIASVLVRYVATGMIVVLMACQRERAVRTIVHRGVELRPVGREARRGSMVSGLEEGDFVLASPALRIAVAGAGRQARTVVRGRPGDVVRVVVGNGETWPGEAIVPLVRAEGRDLVLRDHQFETLLVNDRPTLRWTATARTPSGAMLRVRRDYALSPGRHAVVVHTQVEHAGGPVARNVTVGARLSWRAAAPFVPGAGIVTEARSLRAPWIAWAPGSVAFGWVTLSGDLEWTFRPSRLEGVPPSGRVDAVGPSRNLLAGETFESMEYLLALQGDLADVASAAATVRGEPVRWTALRLNGGDATEVFVTVTRLDHRPVVTATLRPGQVRSIALYDGEYVAYAYATGHTPSEPVRFSAGGDEPVDLTLPPGGRIRFVARDAETERELPVRVVVRGVDGTPAPLLGPRHEAAGADTVVVSSTGRGEITVPPGRYELVFSHGPEWTIARARVSVTRTLRGDVSVQLAHVIPMSDWTACDLHVHARPSGDSLVSIADRVASLVAEGIEFAAPSEHNVVGDYSSGVAALPSVARPEGGGSGLAWVPAVEVTTDRAEQPSGHFNVYPYVPGDGGPPPYLVPPREIFRAVRHSSPEAIIQVNHPRMGPSIGYFDRVQLDPSRNIAVSSLYDPGYDAIEVFSGYDLGAPVRVTKVLEDWLALLATGARYVGTASSDSHEIAYHGAGYPRTYVYTPGAGDRAPDDPAVVVRALRQGRAFGTSGPMLFVRIGDALPGDTVRTSESSVTLNIKVMAAPWIDVDQVDIYRDGVRVESVPVPASSEPLRLDHNVTLPLGGARSFFVVVARGDRTLDVVLPYRDARPFAFTNPIWVERTNTVPLRRMVRGRRR